MALSRETLAEEWKELPKDWYSIYQWQRTTGYSYTEWISEWIEEAISQSQIVLVEKGLRQRSFNVTTHQGQIELNTSIDQLTEKRLVRAVFNQLHNPILGKIIDYEVPLKDSNDDKHGDVDLLCVLNESILCIEAKHPESSESLLKAILQAFTYTSLLATKREIFLKDYDLSPNLRLTPSVLTFANTQSFHQIKEQDQFPNLWRLVATLNSKLKEKQIEPYRFFVVENPNAELATCLTTSLQPNKDVKVIFSEGFDLKVVEYPLNRLNAGE